MPLPRVSHLPDRPGQYIDVFHPFQSDVLLNTFARRFINILIERKSHLGLFLFFRLKTLT